MLQIIRDVKYFGGQHDLCQDPGIDNGESLMIDQVRFVQDDGFVNRKQAEQDPKVSEYPEQPPSLGNPLDLDLTNSIGKHLVISPQVTATKIFRRRLLRGMRRRRSLVN